MQFTCSEKISKAEGYGPFRHTLVAWTDEQGRKCCAYINPTLFEKHGLDALNQPDWHKGDED